MKNRYITYWLCDNDFGQHMERAAKWLVEFYGVEELKRLEDVHFRGAMASHMAGEHVARGYAGGPGNGTAGLQWYFDYFNKARIDRTEEGSKSDGDSGVVSIDLATGYVWRH